MCDVEKRREEGVVHSDVRLNPKETERPELCRRSVIMLFHDCAAHWSDHIVRLSFINKSLFVMTALPSDEVCWFDMTQTGNLERLPDRPTNNPG